MEPQGLKRKISAILSADVQGYSRLMSEDEEARETVAKYLRLRPTAKVSRVLPSVASNNPSFLEQRERLRNLLRKAGMPE